MNILLLQKFYPTSTIRLHLQVIAFLNIDKNELYLLANNDLIVKKLDIRIKVHNIT